MRNMQVFNGPKWATQFICIYVMCGVIVATNPQQKAHDTDAEFTERNDKEVNFYEAARNLLLEGDAEALTSRADDLVKSVPYIRASMPMRIYECIREYSILRCTKLFVLQKMEERRNFPNSGNLTKDFMDQFFGDESQLHSLITEKYRNMPEKELNQRLVTNFQRFFKNRDIKLHFLPGILVKIVPSKENTLKFTLKKKTKVHNTDRGGRAVKSDDVDENSSAVQELDADTGDTKIGGAGGIGIGPKRKHKRPYSYKDAMIQLAVPVMVMPAVLMGSILPFLLPVLKMATIMSLLLNNSAFMAALIYAARTHANAQEEQHISYGYASHPGYH